MISRHSLISLSNNQVSCDLAGEAAILNLADGVYYGLDQVGAFVWNMLGAPRTVADLCAGVIAEYDVDPEQCERDLLILLEDLASKGLVTVSGGESA
jgi:Coenzyme PQQ synthesis protein D (PqqD)